MSREIFRSRQARIDVLKSAYYIAEKASLNASDRFLQAVEAAYKRIAEMPGMGTLRDYDNPSFSGMRMWPVPRFPKYLIFYRATDEELEIVRVLHEAQNIEAIFAPPDEE